MCLRNKANSWDLVAAWLCANNIHVVGSANHDEKMPTAGESLSIKMNELFLFLVFVVLDI